MIERFEHNYLTLLDDVLMNGERTEDRTGTGTLSVFARVLDVPGDVPALPVTKRLFHRGVIAEMCWMLQGRTNVRWLQERNVHIWDAWAGEDGELGPVYGEQLRGNTDQWCKWLRKLKRDPSSRRHVIALWNPALLDEMALVPCHGLVIQGYRSRHGLQLQMYQRSADMFLGLPFNMLFYQLLGRMAADYCGVPFAGLRIVLGDAHIYLNHLEQVREQLARPDRWMNTARLGWAPPAITIRKGLNLLEPQPSDFDVTSYKPMGTIKAEVSI